MAKEETKSKSETFQEKQAAEQAEVDEAETRRSNEGGRDRTPEEQTAVEKARPDQSPNAV